MATSWFCTLLADALLRRLVLPAHAARWIIEQLYEDAWQECYLDHSQGRSPAGTGVDIWPWSCWCTAFSWYTRSLPGVHRQVLLWLLPPQIESFLPRRNEQSRTSRQRPGRLLPPYPLLLCLRVIPAGSPGKAHHCGLLRPNGPDHRSVVP